MPATTSLTTTSAMWSRRRWPERPHPGDPPGVVNPGQRHEPGRGMVARQRYPKPRSTRDRRRHPIGDPQPPAARCAGHHLDRHQLGGQPLDAQPPGGPPAQHRHVTTPGRGPVRVERRECRGVRGGPRGGATRVPLTQQGHRGRCPRCRRRLGRPRGRSSLSDPQAPEAPDERDRQDQQQRQHSPGSPGGHAPDLMSADLTLPLWPIRARDVGRHPQVRVVSTG